MSDETLTEFFERLNDEYGGVLTSDLKVGEIAEWIRADRDGAEWKNVADALAAIVRYQKPYLNDWLFSFGVVGEDVYTAMCGGCAASIEVPEDDGAEADWKANYPHEPGCMALKSTAALAKYDALAAS